MNGENLLKSLGGIDERFVAEAMSVGSESRRIPFGAETERRPRHIGVAVAACLAAALIASVFFASLRRGASEGDVLLGSGEPGTVESPYLLPSRAPQTSEVPAVSDAPEALLLDMGAIHINEQEGIVSDIAPYYDPALYRDERWDADAVSEYFGRSFAPAWWPGDLALLSDGGLKATVNRESGEVVWDELCLVYRDEDYPDPIKRGFTVIASKLGLGRCCVYMTDSTETSDVFGTDVVFGHCSLSYGPYDPDTHEPSGWYDVYLADFELGGAQVSVTANRLTEEEFVKAVASIISRTDDIELVGA